MPMRENRIGIFLSSFFMQISDCYKIGYILKPHGLKGEVTISLDAEAPDDIASLEIVFVEQNNRLIPHFIQSVSQNGNKAFVKFEDIDTIETATNISKSPLYLPKSARPKSEKGDFYDDEIIGFAVQDKDAGFLGNIEAVEQAGPNKLLMLKHLEKEVLIPVNGPFILGINKSKKVITVLLPEGFLEI
jgi:16S rRNA processing protein RimM